MQLIAREHQEQEALFQRANLDPRCKLLYAIPNDGKRSWKEGARFKRRGLKPGMPDTHLPKPSPNGYHSLYIELKRKIRPAPVTADQAEKIYELNQEGNYACVCIGWEKAWQVIQDYLAGRIPNPQQESAS